MSIATFEPTPAELDPQRRLWTRADYHRAGELGIFQPDERLELIEGEVLRRMSPIGSPHRTSVYLVSHALEEAFGPGFYVDQDAPITISDVSEPQPDVLVARGSYEDYEDRHPGPADCMVVVEVSDSTIGFDRGQKSQLFASAGIPEYWVLNLGSRRLEVFRDPSDSGYRTTTDLSERDSVAPLAKPDASIRIAGLLPRKR
jgi:Uma2 family endonuclease